MGIEKLWKRKKADKKTQDYWGTAYPYSEYGTSSYYSGYSAFADNESKVKERLNNIKEKTDDKKQRLIIQLMLKNIRSYRELKEGELDDAIGLLMKFKTLPGLVENVSLVGTLLTKGVPVPRIEEYIREIDELFREADLNDSLEVNKIAKEILSADPFAHVTPWIREVREDEEKLKEDLENRERVLENFTKIHERRKVSLEEMEKRVSRMAKIVVRGLYEPIIKSGDRPKSLPPYIYLPKTIDKFPTKVLNKYTYIMQGIHEAMHISPDGSIIVEKNRINWELIKNLKSQKKIISGIGIRDEEDEKFSEDIKRLFGVEGKEEYKTFYEVAKEFPERLLFQYLLNIVEDIRIDTLSMERFPGFRKYIKTMIEVYAKDRPALTYEDNLSNFLEGLLQYLYTGKVKGELHPKLREKLNLAAKMVEPVKEIGSDIADSINISMQIMELIFLWYGKEIVESKAGESEEGEFDESDLKRAAEKLKEVAKESMEKRLGELGERKKELEKEAEELSKELEEMKRRGDAEGAKDVEEKLSEIREELDRIGKEQEALEELKKEMDKMSKGRGSLDELKKKMEKRLGELGERKKELGKEDEEPSSEERESGRECDNPKESEMDSKKKGGYKVPRGLTNPISMPILVDSKEDKEKLLERLKKEAEKSKELKKRGLDKLSKEEREEYEYVHSEVTEGLKYRDPKGDLHYYEGTQFRHPVMEVEYPKTEGYVARGYNGIIQKIHKSFEELVERKIRESLDETRGRFNVKAYLNWKNEVRQNALAKPEFWQRRKDESNKASVLILIDLSGSTARNGAIEGERDMVYVLAKALRDLGELEYEIAGFASVHGRELTYYLKIKDFDSGIAKIPYLDIPENVGFCCVYENRDGAAIRHAIKKLKERNSKNKLLIVVSDGEPLHGGTSYEESEAVRDVREAVKQAEKELINVVSVIVQHEDSSEYKEMYGRNRIVNKDIKKLGVDIAKVIANWWR